jgi:hypothetical protein
MSFWDQLVDELRALGETIAEWAVLIGISLLVLIIGRFILKWVKTLIERLLGANFLQPVWDRSGISGALEGTGQTPASITATVVYAYLWVALWLVVARILKLPTIVALLERLLAFLPLLVLATFVVILAAAIGSWVGDLVRPFARENHVGWLAWVVQVAIILFGVLFALDLLDINFAENIVLIVAAAIGVAFAIAFGVGGIDTAKQWWSRYFTPSAMGRMEE